MDDKKIAGVQIIGWTVFVSNAGLLIFHCVLGIFPKIQILHSVISLLSVIAVFPATFFFGYLSDAWLWHILWMVVMIIFSIGILRLSQSARKIFIVFNVIHIVVLSFITFASSGTNQFLDYFFYGTLILSSPERMSGLLPQAR